MAKVFTITEGLENMGALKTGGQGSVYKGRRTGQIITAVKLLPTPIHTEDPNDKSYRDFQNEVNKLKKVNQEPNPNVVKILNFGITDTGSFPFIEMEFIEGPDLEELLKPPHDPIFTIKEAVKVAEQLSNALAHCHRQDVKHGDIKSNNVKFNKHTGNYVLLDFGMAAMSDEQRRTSLRRAGAAEFMSPEQLEGQLLFQSDIYSFGIIIYELLAGIVPFPLNDKGETARNAILLAHRETPPPDPKQLRRQNLPEEWSDIKKKRESEIPEWLVTLVYKCLRKKPSERFLNGSDLHEFITLNSTLPSATESIAGPDKLVVLKKQNEQLLREKEQLQQALLKYQKEATAKDHELQRMQALLSGGNYQYDQRRKGGGAGWIVATLITLVFLAGIGYVLMKDRNQEPDPSVSRVAKDTTPSEPVRTFVGRFRVASSRAYFHNEPTDATRRSGFLQMGDLIEATDQRNGFVYTEFTNTKGQRSSGWVLRQDLITEKEWDDQKESREQNPEVLYRPQLERASNMMKNGQVDQALAVYKVLVEKEVPEAMYNYGNLALQNQNPEIDCGSAFLLVKKAADKDYIPAKRTLGYLYLFAGNTEVIASANYDRCSYEKDTRRGLQLLTEAANRGDEAAKSILEQFNAAQPPSQ